jgi:hypothetical protein
MSDEEGVRYDVHPHGNGRWRVARVRHQKTIEFAVCVWGIKDAFAAAVCGMWLGGYLEDYEPHKTDKPTH